MGAPTFDFQTVLTGCLHGDRNCQRRLYEHFYGYGMSICLRYAHHRDEAAAILNDGFFKALQHIGQFDTSKPFRFWLRRILINTAIDHFRAQHRFAPLEEWTAAHETAAAESFDFEISPDEDALPILQKLSPAYRTVFNLYILEEFSHQEIAEMLGISAAASRSNLTRAKEQLREIWIKVNGRPTTGLLLKNKRNE